MASIEESSLKAIAERFHSEESSSVVFLFDENCRIVATLTEQDRVYSVEGCKENWLASVTLCKKAFSAAILYEKQCEVGTSSLFKRSSFLPKMVFKEEFLENVNGLTKKALHSKPLK